ncbi:MAG: hypothetical protein J6U21_10265 [Bacteroidales bacterium]|nr:hypothetical protein [Bacteroidales bacterium]
MARHTLILLLVVLSCGIVRAQGDIDTEKKILYRNEWSIGAIVKTNGFEMDFRSGKFVNMFKKNLLDFGIGFIKHPQQYRAVNPYYSGYSGYCFGKKNFCFELFYTMGRQRMLFQKADLNSVEIRVFYMCGVTLAFLKPIYYEILKYKDLKTFTESEKFDVDTHNPVETLGPSEFTKGFSEMKVIPGVEGKAGLSIEFGKKDTHLMAMEAGIKLSAYAKKLEIMAQKRNPQFICALFFSFRFGRVKHGAHYEYLNDYVE